MNMLYYWQLLYTLLYSIELKSINRHSSISVSWISGYNRSILIDSTSPISTKYSWKLIRMYKSAVSPLLSSCLASFAFFLLSIIYIYTFSVILFSTHLFLLLPYFIFPPYFSSPTFLFISRLLSSPLSVPSFSLIEQYLNFYGSTYLTLRTACIARTHLERCTARMDGWYYNYKYHLIVLRDCVHRLLIGCMYVRVVKISLSVFIFYNSYKY